MRDRSHRQPNWRRYLRFWGANVGADVDEELSFHIEMLIEENLAAGVSMQQAREAAHKRFGEYEAVEQACRRISGETERMVRRTEQMDTVLTDLKYGVRQIRANPALSAAAIVTLALGIGATTAIFSVVNSVLLQPLPYADADRIVMLYETWRGGNGRVSPGHIADWKEQSTAFESVSAFQGASFNLAEDGGDPERVYGARVSPEFFDIAAIRPAQGRYFAGEEAIAGRDRVVVLSHPLWERRYGADPRMVGRQIQVNGEAYTVVGVTPREYTLTTLDEALWVPFAFTPEQRSSYGSHTNTVFAKLKPGVPLNRANDELVRLTAEINKRDPEGLAGRSARVADFREQLVGGYRTQLLVLLGAVAFVLLLAVANIANLLLARSRTRQREVSIRAALGAGRSRLIRQLLTESIVLSFSGGLVGLGLAALGIRFLTTLGPEGVPRLQDAGLDPLVLAFAFAVAVGSGLLFGIVPALRSSRAELQSTLREGGRSGAMGAVRDRLRGALVVAEIAVALVLMVGAGLLVRSAILLQGVDPGFQPRGVLTARLALPEARYGDAETVAGAYKQVIERLRALPGVRSAGGVSALPMSGGSTDVGLRVEGRTFAADEMPIAHFRIVTPDYHRTIGIPVTRGRALAATDGVGAPNVVLINESLARQLWPNQSPIGERVSCCAGDTGPVWREIVGVTGDVRHFGLTTDPQPELHIPFEQAPPQSWGWNGRALSIVVAATDPAGLAGPMREAVWSLDRSLPVFELRTYDDVLARSTAERRFNTWLLSALGITGLLLAVVGIYGVISYLVSQRTQEIGLRVALGATAGDIRKLVLRQGAVLAVLGVAIGLAASVVTTRVLANLLFGVGAMDPVTVAASCSVLMASALLASYLPARRAMKVDPATSLKSA